MLTESREDICDDVRDCVACKEQYVRLMIHLRKMETYMITLKAHMLKQ